MSHQILLHSIGSLRALGCAVAIALAALVFTPPSVLGQDAPAGEAATEDAATEDAAAEETTDDTKTDDDAAEEKKPWNVAAPCDNVQHPYE
ncbi:hypothetical protein, partial [Methyloceanibacter sp.]|uniref:hypothetical protein n=1 Tax=Methyloceanibacter sp. TaxID=1965321 RepID=UPI00356B25F4